MEKREKVLHKKAKLQNIRTRQRNVAERRLLDRRLKTLEKEWNQYDEQMYKKIRELDASHHVHEELRLLMDGKVAFSDMLADMDNSSHKRSREVTRSSLSVRCESSDNFSSTLSLPKVLRMRVVSAPLLGQRRNRRPEPEVDEPNTEKWTFGLHNKYRDFPECKFKADKHCRNFPCSLPIRYNKIGFDLATKGREATSFLTSSCTHIGAMEREQLLVELEDSSVRRSCKSTTDQTHIKERALKQIIEEMKVKRDKLRPQDWSINYGKPISKRKLYRVARPSTADA